MVDIREFKYMPLRKMMKLFTDPEDVTVDINKIAEVLEVTVEQKDLSKYQTGAEKIMCAFATTEDEAYVFYNEELLVDSEYAKRVLVMTAFAKYISTCQKEFVITSNTELSHWEKTLLSEMLMPQDEVKKAIKGLLIPTTYGLGEIFKVPQDFVRERLKELKIPIMIAGYNY